MPNTASMSDYLPLLGVVAGGMGTALVARKTALGPRVWFYLPIVGLTAGMAYGLWRGNPNAEPILGVMGVGFLGALVGGVVGGYVVMAGLLVLTLADFTTYLRGKKSDLELVSSGLGFGVVLLLCMMAGGVWGAIRSLRAASGAGDVLPSAIDQSLSAGVASICIVTVILAILTGFQLFRSRKK